jgi:hypothetical protein
VSEKTYLASSLSSLVSRIVDSFLWQGRVNTFALKTEPDNVLVVVDSHQDLAPISGKAIWPIHVLPGIHAAELAREIWDHLDWTDIAPNDGKAKDLFDHILDCDLPIEDADQCSAVVELDPWLVDEKTLSAKGWWCRRIVWKWRG